MREKQPLKKVLVTSALPKEGKSFVAANLAQVMVRQHGRRALLDRCRPARSAACIWHWARSAKPGLAEYLHGRDATSSAPCSAGQWRICSSFRLAGNSTNPAELMANGRLKTAVSNRVEPLFDWIIIDSPPAVPVSDGSLLANFCDGVLMVVRSNATPFDIARKARQEFEDKALIGVVLNGIAAGSSPYTQYYYGAYGRPQTKERGETQR